MKKILAISLAFVIMLSATACSMGKGNNTNGGADANAPESALALLNGVWEKYGDDEKFPVAGGDFSEENASTEGPGKYAIEDAEAVDAALGFPAAQIDKIDDAASLSNMMNANNFTCAAYHLKDAGTSADVVAAIKENISTRQWMCGFPEKLVIITIGDYVVAMFGLEELIAPFQSKLAEVYTGAETVCDEPIL